ncbi:transcription factor BIM1 isoform X2 [Prosopis cineraria]|uniref:transcription factor BIM1 isoform X2 n=1 Tax=Prosopis cineraria TaxID=364024 RepID=UPI00240FAD57|nr:transcription factor BIM1 isoform X2 [Prosopis cineraria]
MELPQARPFGTEARKPTHDSLSLYSHSTAQHDPRPPCQGSYLKTRDFLQPLERVEKKANTKEEASDEISSVVQKLPPSAPPPPPCVEHILPGGIGTYSISHISYCSNPRVPKPEATLFTVSPCEASTDRNEENSNCSSYTGSGFTLWEESTVKKGKTGKENEVGEKSVIAECAAKPGQWSVTERASQSFVKNHQNSFNSATSSQKTGQKNQSFIDMIKSAKDCSQDEELDNEEAFIFKKESSNTQQRGELRVKVDGKSSEQRPNTPRSKHSATEQRRRSKINDRFQMLRELIPHSDQKRDKASFLLEVIEYIQFLQDKVHRHEGSYQVWNQEKEKLTPWRNNHRRSESYDDQSRVINSGSPPPPILLFPSKMEEENFSISPTITGATKNVDAGTSSATTLKSMNQHPGMTNKAVPIPNSPQPNFFNPVRSGGPGRLVSQLTHKLTSDAENTLCNPLGQSQTYSSATGVTAASDKLKEKELTVESGAISISSVYSKGLLDSLTHALKNSGVDLSQASISVQIELGKQANIGPIGPTSGVKDEVTCTKQGMKRSRVCSVEESDLAVKKLKTSRS